MVRSLSKPFDAIVLIQARFDEIENVRPQFRRHDKMMKRPSIDEQTLVEIRI